MPGGDALPHQIGDFLGNHPRLAAASAGQYQQRTVDDLDGGLLLGVEFGGHLLLV